MPLFYQQHINQHTRLAIWKIEESESFFANTVPLQSNISHPHKRLQHFAGRYLLRCLFPAFPYNEILIADTRKPYLFNEAYHFSISHCKDFAAAIVSTQERVGIDIENQHNKIEKIADKFLNEKEKQILKQYRTTINKKPATLIWAAKEAMFKWYGLGNIDFKKMLFVDAINLNDKNGVCNAVFKTDIALNINYILFKEFYAAFICQ